MHCGVSASKVWTDSFRIFVAVWNWHSYTIFTILNLKTLKKNTHRNVLVDKFRRFLSVCAPHILNFFPCTFTCKERGLKTDISSAHMIWMAPEILCSKNYLGSDILDQTGYLNRVVNQVYKSPISNNLRNVR